MIPAKVAANQANVFDLMCQLSPALQIHNELEKTGRSQGATAKRAGPDQRSTDTGRKAIWLTELLEGEGKDVHRGVQEGGPPGLAFRTKPQYVRKQRGS